MRLALVTVAVLVVSGCAAPSCLQEQPYESVEEFPTLDAPPGLIVPAPNLTMQIPEVEDGPVGVYPNSEGREPPRMRCLVVPRRFEAGSG